MVQRHTRRSSPHPWIDTVWRTISIEDGIYRATPDGSWDLILSYGPDGQPTLWLTGQATEPVDVPYRGGSHAVVVSFAAHVFLACEKQVLTGATVRLLPVEGNHFALGGVELPLPTFEDAEALVDKMIAAGLLQSNDLVAKAFSANPKAASKRSVQQHFKTITGITQKDFEQIRRAQEAVRLLKSGASAAAVAADLGYTDQPHMIKSIKKIMGHLPSNLDPVHKI
jgi:AraC-like DNA-binding protein